MPGLKLKLRPDEELLINGAVLQNGAYPVELTVKTPNTRILRLRDALHPNDANTPVRRVCYVAQLAVAGAVSDDLALTDFCQGAEALLSVFLDQGSQELLQEAIYFAQKHNFYKAMQNMRKLMKYEESLLLRGTLRRDEGIPSQNSSPSATSSRAQL